MPGIQSVRYFLGEIYDAVRTRTLFAKAARVAGLDGDYVEFGAFRGTSFISAYKCYERYVRELLSARWRHAMKDPERSQAAIAEKWESMRFIAFDSFEGMPAPGEVDSRQMKFAAGTYRCSEAQFLDNVRRAGIPMHKVVPVKGWFEETLVPGTAQKLGLREIALIHVDSDLYESARLALNFCTPHLRDGTIVIFDEWFQFRGNPGLGEQRAFNEWRRAHSEWAVSEFQKEGPFRNSFILSTPQQ